ncbi:MAG: tail fiber domain-containing protein [bacterium]|nr:MAG: tail fiber domain-containing protein [bacterium]
MILELVNLYDVSMFFKHNGYVGFGTTNPTDILTIQQNSATDPIADAWTTYSSKRWKTNIKQIDGALDKVNRLRGVCYDWKADGKHDIGLIAEEVGEVIPEVVAYEQNGKDAKSIDYTRLVAVLIEAIKEQQKQIEMQQAAIETLMNNNR